MPLDNEKFELNPSDQNFLNLRAPSLKEIKHLNYVLGALRAGPGFLGVPFEFWPGLHPE